MKRHSTIPTEVEPGIFKPSDTEAPAIERNNIERNNIELAPYLVIVNRVEYRTLIEDADKLLRLLFKTIENDGCHIYHTCETGATIARIDRTIAEAKSRLAK